MTRETGTVTDSSTTTNTTLEITVNANTDNLNNSELLYEDKTRNNLNNRCPMCE
jgi:hypothetical protein